MNEYLRNCGRGKSKQHTAWIQPWTLNQVYGHKNAESIKSTIWERYSLKPGDKQYLGKLSKVCKERIGSLSEEAVEEYKKELEQWNDRKPPTDVQRK